MNWKFSFSIRFTIYYRIELIDSNIRVELNFRSTTQIGSN